MTFQTFGNHDAEVVIIPWVMTWDGVVRELAVAATGITILHGSHNTTHREPNEFSYHLEPLGISSGATFAHDFAFTYLSWSTYLTDDLYESFQRFLESFNGHVCKDCQRCSDHSSQCQCPSVVDCGDVLPHLYANGFSFKDAFSLKGMQYENSGSSKTYKQTSETKRTCANFHSQLQSVISGNTLSNLLTSIDEFLYLFRYYFLSNLSTFWTIYIGLILYTFFFLLDTLRVRSHLKLTASHVVPPLALLTSGKPLPITKLTYITQ